MAATVEAMSPTNPLVDVPCDQSDETEIDGDIDIREGQVIFELCGVGRYNP